MEMDLRKVRLQNAAQVKNKAKIRAHLLPLPLQKPAMPASHFCVYRQNHAPQSLGYRWLEKCLNQKGIKRSSSFAGTARNQARHYSFG